MQYIYIYIYIYVYIYICMYYTYYMCYMYILYLYNDVQNTNFGILEETNKNSKTFGIRPH